MYLVELLILADKYEDKGLDTSSYRTKIKRLTKSCICRGVLTIRIGGGENSVGNGNGYGNGGFGNGNGWGYGNGFGCGNGDGWGDGYGCGNGYGNGYGNGDF